VSALAAEDTPFKKYIQRRGERDRQLEISMREKHQLAASWTLPTEDVPPTKVLALNRNQTWDPSVFRPTVYPLSKNPFESKYRF
jgi:hypothetical protein